MTDYTEQAAQLDRAVTELKRTRAAMDAELVALIGEWEREIAPLKEVMAKHGLWFRHPDFPEFRTRLGVIVGAPSEPTRRPLVLWKNWLICPVSENDEANMDHAVSLNQFAAMCDC